MSTPTKRAREEKRAKKARDKARKRDEKRDRAPAAPEIVTQEAIVGRMRPTEDVLDEIKAAPSMSRSAAPIPSKLFIGSLSDRTTSATLRAHFEEDFEIIEAVVITDRATGASRNFGFVTAADRKDTAAIIDALHQSELDGSSIVVRIATDR